MSTLYFNSQNQKIITNPLSNVRLKTRRVFKNEDLENIFSSKEIKKNNNFSHLSRNQSAIFTEKIKLIEYKNWYPHQSKLKIADAITLVEPELSMKQ